MWWLNKITKIFTGTIERPSPSNIVKEQGIKVSSVDTMVIIDLNELNIPLSKTPRVWIPFIPDTNSMDGIFDLGNNNILIAGKDDDDHRKLVNFINVGDIAVYRVMVDSSDDPTDFTKLHKFYAIHRVIKIGKDGNGIYFKFKGDNNALADPYKVRNREILWLSIGTIY